MAKFEVRNIGDRLFILLSHSPTGRKETGHCVSEHGLECWISNSLRTAAPFPQKQSENVPFFFSGERAAVLRLDFKPVTPADRPLGRVNSRYTKVYILFNLRGDIIT